MEEEGRARHGKGQAWRVRESLRRGRGRVPYSAKEKLGWGGWAKTAGGSACGFWEPMLSHSSSTPQHPLQEAPQSAREQERGKGEGSLSEGSFGQ